MSEESGKKISNVGKILFDNLNLYRPKEEPEWFFWTFNTYRATNKGVKGLPDHIGINVLRGFLFFVEVKGTGDSLSPAQIAFKIAIEVVAALTDRVIYLVMTDSNQWEDVISYYPPSAGQ